MDIQVLTALALPISIMFFILEALIGWVARDYMMNYREIPRPHPEMFDPNGNLVPDEIVAFRFENNYDDDSEEEDDQLNAKVNQSKKNLGAPPLPGIGWALPREVLMTRFVDQIMNLLLISFLIF